MKKVVVLGGGYAGTSAALRLDKNRGLDVTLVDRREVMVHKIAGLRASVSPEWPQKVLVPRDKLLKRGKIVVGTVKSVQDSTVVLENGTKLEFDYLVCATGARSASPAEVPFTAKTNKECIEYFHSCYQAVKTSESIIVIGGGLVGVELSGELRAASSSAKITIVHAANELINTIDPPLNASSIKKLYKKLDALKIDVVVGDRVQLDMEEFQSKPYLQGKRTLLLASCKTLEADLVFNCSGTSLNTSCYPASWKDEKGAIKVEPSLQVVGQPNVFAAGDLTSLCENKMGYLAMTYHGPVIARNISDLAARRVVSKTYAPQKSSLLMIPMGPSKGMLATSFYLFGNFWISNMKGKHLFCGPIWSIHKKKAPRQKRKSGASVQDDAPHNPATQIILP